MSTTPPTRNESDGSSTPTPTPFIPANSTAGRPSFMPTEKVPSARTGPSKPVFTPSNLGATFQGANSESPYPQPPVPGPPAKISLPLLLDRSGGLAIIQDQRRSQTAQPVAVISVRLIDSLYTTDKFEWTDKRLLDWFKKATMLSNFEVPFFSVPTLATLMLKESKELKTAVDTAKTKVKSLRGILRANALVALTEAIFKAYCPSAPTIIKLAIHFLAGSSDLTDDS